MNSAQFVDLLMGLLLTWSAVRSLRDPQRFADRVNVLKKRRINRKLWGNVAASTIPQRLRQRKTRGLVIFDSLVVLAFGLLSLKWASTHDSWGNTSGLGWPLLIVSGFALGLLHELKMRFFWMIDRRRNAPEVWDLVIAPAIQRSNGGRLGGAVM